LELPITLVGFRTQFLSPVVMTLGEELEQTCRRLREQGDLLRSIFLDAAGLAMLELLSKAAFEIISGLARERDLFAGHRMIPGCCYGLDMSLQETLFHLVDGAAIGVFLNASLVMTPLKSQSFFVSLTPDPGQATPSPKCLSCPRRDCLFRHTDRI
jgi:cobalamin-dependent methionine synthase I